MESSSMKFDVGGKSPKPPKRRSGAFRALIAVFIVLVVALVGVVAYVIIDFSKIWSDPGSGGVIIAEESDDVEGLPEASVTEGDVTEIDKAENEIDIIMVGVDNREDKFTGRSDVMMYLRVNTETKTIKMVSFMRDTLVSIDGHDRNKLNTAFGFGGTELMYDTYHNSFGLDPDYYIIVNFYGMEDIIDAMGGVDIQLDSDELKWLNININEINKEASSGDVDNINTAGLQHLNGRQAVAYMRIRHPGGDNGRIERQQTVMYKLFAKAQQVSAGQLPDLMSSMVQYVRTDMPLNTMLDLATSVRGMSMDNLSTFRYPDKFINSRYGTMSVVQPEDANDEFEKLYNFLNS